MSPALRIKLFFALAALCLASAARAQGSAYAVSGRVIDRLNGYGAGSVVELPDEDLDAAALAGAVEELEKN